VTTLLDVGVKAEVMDTNGCTPLALVLMERRKLERMEAAEEDDSLGLEAPTVRAARQPAIPH
jgi:hypothetical protein